MRGKDYLPIALANIEKAIEQAGIDRNHPDSDWLHYPVIQNVLIVLAYQNGGEVWRYNRQLVLTHLIIVANNTVNDPHLRLDGKDRVLRAFRLLIHDLGEKAWALRHDPDRMIAYTVTLLRNEDGYTDEDRKACEDSAHAYTDPPHLYGGLRFRHQEMILKETDDEEMHHGRTYDKLSQAETGDRDHFKAVLDEILVRIKAGEPIDGQYVAEQAENTQNAYGNALDRAPVVQAATLVRDELKARHAIASNDLRLIARQLWDIAAQCKKTAEPIVERFVQTADEATTTGPGSRPIEQAGAHQLCMLPEAAS